MTPRITILIGGRASEVRRWAPSWVRANGYPACTLCGPRRHVGGGQGSRVPPPSRVRGVRLRRPPGVAQGLKCRSVCDRS